MVDKWTPAESEAFVSAPVADTTVCTDSSGKRVVDFYAWVVSIFTHSPECLLVLSAYILERLELCEYTWEHTVESVLKTPLISKFRS